MRGADEQPGSMFSYVSLEDRVPPDHPLRAIRRITDRALERLSPQFGSLYVTFGVGRRFLRRSCSRALLLQALYSDSQRTAVDRAARLQPAVSVVRRPGHGRRRLGADDVYQESRSLAQRGHRRRLLRCGVDPRRHRAAALGRALHRRRDLVGRLGQSEELPSARSRSAGRWRRQSDREFSRPAAHQRDPSVDDGSRRAVVQESPRARGAPRVLGACADGAPVGSDREDDGHPGRRPWRTRCGGRDDRGPPRAPSAHGRPPTKATTRATSSPGSARCTPHRTSRSTPRVDAARSTRARRGIPATRSVNRNGSSSNKASAG